ncbi:MAG: CHAD domain-containing protein [Filomicrobium sp.]
MAFRFTRKESFKSGFYRIAQEQISRALKEWDNDNRPIAVHETRKCLKRIRSLLRLFRPVIAPDQFRRENARLRDIGRELSTCRDLQVKLELTLLLRHQPKATTKKPKQAANLDRALKALHEDLASKIEGSAGSTAAPPRQRIAKALEAANKSLQSVAISSKGFAAVGPGLELSYKLGRKAMADVIAGRGGEEASHEWRKQVQAHWRQTALLSNAWPELFAARVALARKLSEELGQDHDLAVLRDYVRKADNKKIGADDVKLLCELIDARQAALREMALADGALLYAEKPAELRSRVRKYWKSARNPPSGKAKQRTIKSVEAQFAQTASAGDPAKTGN